MSISAELMAAVQRYIEGQWSLADLRRWRRSRAQELADSSDEGVVALYGTLAHALAEHLSGDRSEGRVREALEAELGRTTANGRTPATPLPSHAATT